MQPNWVVMVLGADYKLVSSRGSMQWVSMEAEICKFNVQLNSLREVTSRVTRDWRNFIKLHLQRNGKICEHTLYSNEIELKLYI